MPKMRHTFEFVFVSDTGIEEQVRFLANCLEEMTNGGLAISLRTKLPRLVFDLRSNTSPKEPLAEHNKVLEIPVEALRLSPDSSTALRNANITNMRELVQRTEQQLLDMSFFTRHIVEEIKALLKSLDLRLGMKLD